MKHRGLPPRHPEILSAKGDRVARALPPEPEPHLPGYRILEVRRHDLVHDPHRAVGRKSRLAVDPDVERVGALFGHDGLERGQSGGERDSSESQAVSDDFDPRRIETLEVDASLLVRRPRPFVGVVPLTGEAHRGTHRRIAVGLP
jgi:hypothetical protein